MAANNLPTSNLVVSAIARALDGRVEQRVIEPDGSVRLRVRLRGQETEIRALWSGAGSAKDVKRALADVSDPWPDELVIVARRYTPGAVEILNQRDASWVDTTGRARIVTPSILAVRDPTETPPGKTTTFTWSDSAATIAEAVLSRPWPDGIGTGAIARLTGWSPPQASEVLRSFDEQGWTRKTGPQRGPGAAREVVGAAALLESWAGFVTSQPSEIRYAHSGNRDVANLLDNSLAAALENHTRWAVSGWAAAARLAPFSTAIPTLQIHVAEDDFYGPVSDALRETRLVEVDEGGNIELISVPARRLDLGTTSQGIPLVSAPRVYADLLASGGRGVDTAEHLKDEVILPAHQPFSVRPPSRALDRFAERSLDRLEERLVAAGRHDVFERGAFFVAYRLLGARRKLSVAELADVLARVIGSETGWPVWNLRIAPPQLVGDALEGWAEPRPGRPFADPAHADFWRADPAGRLFLLRGYQEDGEIGSLAPGTALDITLPVWRVGECLLHAQRLAAELAADGLELMTRWTGLEGRELTSVTGRVVHPGRTATQDAVVSNVEVRASEVDRLLPVVVRELVEPLYATFHLFRPPDTLYEEELARMRSTD